MRKPTQYAGALLRNVAILLVNTAERIDPQPPVEWNASLTIYGDGTYTGTTAKLGNVTWHRTG